MQDKETLRKYTMLAERIIYNPQRIHAFVDMLRTREGALRAVKTVIASIDSMRPVPAQMVPYLAANIYFTMVSVIAEGTGAKPDPSVMRSVADSLVKEIQQAQGTMQQKAAQPEQPANVVQRMGVAV